MKDTNRRPTYGQNAHTAREDVEQLRNALTLVFPGTDVRSTHAGPTSEWVLRVLVRHPKGQHTYRIVEEFDGWQVYKGDSTIPVASFAPEPDLIVQVRAVYNYVELEVK